MAQWIEWWPVNQRVTGSIPSQDTCLGFRPGPRLGVCKKQPHTDVSLPVFLPPFLSLKINKSFKKTWFVKFLGTTDILVKELFAVGCLMHWKMFSSTPGLYSPETSSGFYWSSNILKISKSVKLLVKMKKMCFILWKRCNRLFVQTNIYMYKDLCKVIRV